MPDITEANLHIAYGQTEEAHATTAGAKNPVGSGTGNSHRLNLQNNLHPAPASAMSHPSTNNGPVRAANVNSGVTPTRQRVKADPALACNNPEVAPTKRPRAQDRNKKQTRPWPPEGLKDITLVDPGVFMSAVNNMLPTSVAPNLTATSSVNPQPASLQSPQIREPVKDVLSTNTTNANNAEIRKVPVEELLFPVQHALNPCGVSTHTDGAPSPASFSGFSNQGTLSPAPTNLMDTPIVDDMSKIAVMNGQDFVSIAQFQALETKFNLLEKAFGELRRVLGNLKIPKSPEASNSERVSSTRPIGTEEMYDHQEDAENVSSASVQPAKHIGLGISGTALSLAATPTSHSATKPTPLRPRTTNGSIFGDSRVLRPGCSNAASEYDFPGSSKG